jgi:peptidoglycan hydrolase CwlO-like protein
MSESDVSQLCEQLRRMEAKMDRNDEKVDRIEARIEDFAQSNARHSERLKNLDSDVRLAHSRISELKNHLAGIGKRFIGWLLAGCGVMLGIIWKWIEVKIGK